MARWQRLPSGIVFGVFVTAALMFAGCNMPVNDSEMSAPLVVFTFDDGHHSIYDMAFPIMRSYDSSWAATHFLPTNHPGSPGHVTIAQLDSMETVGGWETGGHGQTHENLSSIPLDSVRSQVAYADSFLRAHGLSHESYAYAFGNYNDSVQTIVSQYFDNIRTSHDMKYLGGVNRYELGAYDAKAGHTADDLIGRIHEAELSGSPLVIYCFHVIVPDTAAPDVHHAWWTSEAAFRGLCDYLVRRGMPVYTVREAVRILHEGARGSR